LRFVSEALTDQHDLSQFSCGKEELDDWLRSSALHAAAMNTGRTFVWRADQRGVVAYFTLAAHLIAREQIPRKVGRGSPHRVKTVTRRWWPNAQMRRESAIGERGESTAHRSKLRPPEVANRASRAATGRIER